MIKYEFFCKHFVIYVLGVPKKVEQAERLIFSTLRAKSVIFLFTLLHKAPSAEENDTKIIEFGWVILILCPFLETLSFSNFAWFLRPMSRELYRCFGEAHWYHRNSMIDRCQKIQRKRKRVHMKGHSRHNLRSSVAKISEIWKLLCFKKWA